MVELVHHEHEEMLVRPTMCLDEFLVEQEFRGTTACHAGGFRLLRKTDTEEREKRRQLERAGRYHIKYPFYYCLSYEVYG